MAEIHEGSETWLFDEGRPLGDDSGMGRVYRGRRSLDEAPVAVKLVRRELSNREEVRRSERELEIGEILRTHALRTELRHVLVPIQQLQRGEDLVFILPLASESLRAAIETGPSEALSRLATSSIAAGLSELSEVGVLHRDLKPENVLRHEGRWKLADFGISRALSAKTGTYTFKGWGTRPYIAPEIWLGRPATLRSDLWSLGILAYECATGYRPFESFIAPPQSDDDVTFALSDFKLSDTILERLIRRLLSASPERRPPDAREVTSALDNQRGLDAQQTRLAAAASARSARRAIPSSKTDAGLDTAVIPQSASAAFATLIETAFDQLKAVLPDALLERASDGWRVSWEGIKIDIRQATKPQEIGAGIVDAYSVALASEAPAIDRNYLCESPSSTIQDPVWFESVFETRTGQLVGLNRRDLGVHFQSVGRDVPSTWREIRRLLSPDALVRVLVKGIESDKPRSPALFE